MVEGRFHRQELLFGREGQQRIIARSVAIVGVGGLGSHVAQQLAYLGTRRFVLIDADRVSESNLNRLVGATPRDAAEARLKVEVAERMVRSISGEAHVERIGEGLVSERAFGLIAETDFIFGCVDNDASRLILNELCQAYVRPYLDLATDIDPDDGTFGGRLIYADGQACVSCKNLLDQDAVRYGLASDAAREEEERIYGVRRGALAGTGPAVVSLNGILASLAVTEFMMETTGIRAAEVLLEYKGMMGGIVVRDRELPDFSCYYCKTLRGSAGDSGVDRYLRSEAARRLGHGQSE
jgi:molybdopterin/thiamine biosynthesis adenylyltransferase